MEKKPFVHLFETSEGYYIYDVNTDCILKISRESYLFMKQMQAECVEVTEPQEVKMLKNCGFLKPDKVKKTEHPDTQLLKYHCSNKVEGIILQVTQNCNLRCKYCAYSGGYKNRSHANKRMSETIAIRAIDFLIEHSRESDSVSIGFYGGEPLLEFELIRKCVEYAADHIEGKYIFFNLTTNGTLLKEDVVDFFVKYKVLVTISLDGPEEVHDKNRKYMGSERGSFETIMSNLRLIQQKYPLYFQQNISYNTVFETDNYNHVRDFFNENALFKKAIVMTSMVTDVNSKRKVEKSDRFYEESSYSHFLACLSLLERIDIKEHNSFMTMQISTIGDSRKWKYGKQRNQLPDKWHHGGPCIPGVMRLFVDVTGNFYPCEKVSEICEKMIIGNLEKGYDLKRVEKMLNIEASRGEKCFDCWAYSECKICVGNMSIDDTEDDLERRCINMRNRVENDFKDYCVLKELGVDFDTDSVEIIKKEYIC